MGFPKYSHDPQAVLDYPFHWEPWLADVNDSIDTFTVVLDETGITDADGAPVAFEDDTTPLVVDSSELVTVGVDIVDGTVLAWVSGTTRGNVYPVICHIVTVDGREEDQTILIQGKEH